MPELSTIQHFAIWILPLLFAMTGHEAAHAWAAARCGDTTALAAGRVSLNPLKHIDLIGTLIVPCVVLLLSQFQFAFGWAKPVPINAKYFKNPQRDLILVALAGPVANLLMAIFWAGILKIAFMNHPQSSITALFFLLSAQAGIIINLLLGFLNLLPIPPLDGGRVALVLLPLRWSRLLQKIEPYGFFVILLLIITGGLAFFLNPIVNATIGLLQVIFQL